MAGIWVRQITWKGDTEPTTLYLGMYWLDTSTDPIVPKQLTDLNPVTWSEGGAGGGAPDAHATSHQNGGSDEISVAGLAGLLADAQTPTTHAASHQNSGADEVATATAAADVIPKAGSDGHLAVGFMPTYLGAWRQMGAATIAGADATTLLSITSGLAGDTDIIYMIRVRGINALVTTAESVILRFNNDSGANYGHQQLGAASSTVTGARSTGQTGIPLCYLGAVAGQMGSAFVWVHAKSGFIREVFIQTFGQTAPGTTVVEMITRAAVWNNTADQITRIDILADNANGCKIGSSAEVWALRPIYSVNS